MRLKSWPPAFTKPVSTIKFCPKEFDGLVKGRLRSSLLALVLMGSPMAVLAQGQEETTDWLGNPLWTEEPVDIGVLSLMTALTRLKVDRCRRRFRKKEHGRSQIPPSWLQRPQPFRLR